LVAGCVALIVAALVIQAALVKRRLDFEFDRDAGNCRVIRNVGYGVGGCNRSHDHNRIDFPSVTLTDLFF
jgi:hypothetical protein